MYLEIHEAPALIITDFAWCFKASLYTPYAVSGLAYIAHAC